MREPLSAREASARSSLQYRRLRAPHEPNSVLVTPPIQELLAPLREQTRPAVPRCWSLAPDPQELAIQVRRECFEAACRHSAVYRDVGDMPSTDNDVRALSNRPWIASGHQPRLFHPGVWFKNFVLANMAKQCNAVALNLIVDNDVATDHGVAVPRQRGELWTREMLPWSQRQATAPYEEVSIEVDDEFKSFGRRVERAIAPLTANPLISQLWPTVVERCREHWPLGWAIAAARHQVESRFELQTLELPISSMCELPSVRRWTVAILERLQELHRIHNESLAIFRHEHRIRSRSHPVPDLNATEDWLEAPFWVWSPELPMRRPLWMRHTDSRCELSDRQGWAVADVDPGRAFEAARSTAKIRPRALMTTLFARTMLADRFIHGIGGAKYDQLTDAIMSEFLKVTPPPFLTATATVPLVEIDIDAQTTKVRCLARRIRDLSYNSQRYLDDIPEAAELAAEKLRLLSLANSQARHEQLKTVHQRFQPLVEPLRRVASRQWELASKQLRSDKILSSRETSFCLFDEQKLPGKLLDLAAKVDKLSIK